LRAQPRSRPRGCRRTVRGTLGADPRMWRAPRAHCRGRAGRAERGAGPPGVEGTFRPPPRRFEAPRRGRNVPSTTAPIRRALRDDAFRPPPAASGHRRGRNVGAVSTRQRSFHSAPGPLRPRPSFMAAVHDCFLEGRPERTLHSVCRRSPTHALVRAHGPPPDVRSERNGGSIPLRPPRKVQSGGERCHSRERSPEWTFHSAPGVARLGAACRGQRGALPASGTWNGRSIPHPTSSRARPCSDLHQGRDRANGHSIPHRASSRARSPSPPME
jgi:hypothetical protein